jgi:hypothetical protein
MSNTQALLLKNAVICWSENSLMPDTYQRFEMFERNFRDNYFWKCVEEKEIMKKNQKLDIQNMPTEEKLMATQAKINALQETQNLVNKTEEQKRDDLIKELKEEFSIMKKKVTLDNYFKTLADKRVLSNEIEKEIVRASVRALDTETTALTRAFTLAVGKVEYLIHPHQQFAACQYDQVDPASHLDVVNKVEAIQTLLTKLRNRGTEVDTLTSGTGMVFTVKDLNECLNDFCKQVIKFCEKQMKGRSELLGVKEQEFSQILYVKDQQIAEMDRRLRNQVKNLENLISARLFEKGNQMIYELDNCNRLVNLFKRNIFSMEFKVRQEILEDQNNKFTRQDHFLD